ncbi:hypothetical protein NQP46_13295 [Streptomyces albus]|nr:hypothetical protein NQP46_13295 [Streptomyces albus]
MSARGAAGRERTPSTTATTEEAPWHRTIPLRVPRHPTPGAGPAGWPPGTASRSPSSAWPPPPSAWSRRWPPAATRTSPRSPPRSWSRRSPPPRPISSPAPSRSPSTSACPPSAASTSPNWLSSVGGEGKDGKGGSTATPEEKLTSLASGTHTLRVAGDGPDRQKLTFVDGADEYSLIRDGDQAWAYDGSTGEALHTEETGAKGDRPADDHVSGMSPKELATKALDAADETTRVTVDGTTTVTGRDAYRLALTPKDSGSTVKSVRIAVDAETGTPLKFTVAPSDGGKAIVDAGFSRIDFTRPSTGTFAPPKDAKITESEELAPGDASPGKDAKGDAHSKAPRSPEDAEEALNSLPAPSRASPPPKAPRSTARAGRRWPN